MLEIKTTSAVDINIFFYFAVMGCGCQEKITQYGRSCQQSWGFVLEFICIKQVYDTIFYAFQKVISENNCKDKFRIPVINTLVTC